MLRDCVRSEGIVYLMSGDFDKGFIIERVRFK